ncbi:MAG: potassium-transporting ATPase subunit F [Acidimicrobiales bacterium]|nr:potassium-transporting ATPase subunit F [Acidimicrobiales bacterium]MBO0893847.1 potassium-transporting ATPase subunit F [Acidimicrobiales bacterium]
MTAVQTILLVVAIIVVIYLGLALFKPELF